LPSGSTQETYEEVHEVTIENKWGRPGFEKEIGEIRNTRSLATATANLSLRTRQTIYAYMKRGGIFKRGTWDGCVMNAASGGNVSSVTAAADFFHEPVSNIAEFIQNWDLVSGTATAANRLLEQILLETGLTKESPIYKPPVEDSKVKIFRVRLFTSKETALVEELRKEIEEGAFDADLSELQELIGV